jgi:serine phosphatase RsbU (regulator of sigma subunit)
MKSFFKNFRVNIILRVLLITANIYFIFYISSKFHIFVASVFFIIAAIYQVYRLIRYVETITRYLSRFLQAIKASDYSSTFSPAFHGAVFQELSTGFRDVFTAFQQTRSEREEQYQYMQTVVQHIGVGLIVFDQNGDVQLINNAAKELFGISQLRNIRQMELFSPELIRELKHSGKRGRIVPFERNNEMMHLAMLSTEFKMKNRLFQLVSVQNIQHELERERMAKELDIARQMQLRLLPTYNPNLKGFDIAGLCLPAEETGGDYYDFIQGENGQLFMVIGDVSGKGMPAAIYMTLTKGVLQSLVNASLSPAEALIKMNDHLYRMMDRSSFVTLTLACLDFRQKQLCLARAGHTPALFYENGTGKINQIAPEGIGLGMDKGNVFRKNIREQTLTLKPGDWLVFFTDGFTEAINEKGEQYGETRLGDIILKNKKSRATEMIQIILSDVALFTRSRRQFDDMTMIVIKAE